LYNLLIGTIRSKYINFHEIISSCETINFENLKQLVQTAVSHVSYLCFMKNYCYRMFISECFLDNYIIGIISSNYINLREIMCSYAAKNFKKLKQLV
jgi:hypothetical protein